MADMIRDIIIKLEHVHGDVFRAILFEESYDVPGTKMVFDIIECSGKDLPGMLRWRDRKDHAYDWCPEVVADWEYEPGRARRYDVLTARAIEQFSPASETP